MGDGKSLYTQTKCDEVTTYTSATEKIKDPSLIGHYYELATDFYEFGWGKSFHFCPLKVGEKRSEAMWRYEKRIIDSLGLKPGMKVLDVGCGVGGPMMNIAKASGATIVGINICDYQIRKGEKYVKESGLSHLCSFHKGNFMETDFPDNTFDALYSIEATPHATDKAACYKEMHRILKPGGAFAGYEYALTDAFDPANPNHVEALEAAEHGGSLQRTPYIPEIEEAFKSVGFEVAELRDLCVDGHTFTLPLEKRLTASPWARKATNLLVSFLERLRIAPKGATQVSSFLNQGADGFIKVGKLGIFTPNLFFHAVKK